MPNILLLRAPSTSPDPYESALLNASKSFAPYSLPILQTSFTNIPSLQTLISLGPQPKNYAGVIFTSKRSCEAWIMAAKTLEHASPSLTNDIKSSLAAWTKVPFYVVGKGTAIALGEFVELCLVPDTDVPPELDIRGQDTGTGEQLAHFIVEDIKRSRSCHVKNTLLYLTGDKNRDTVPKILSSGDGENLNIDLDTIQVYETRGTSDFESNLNSLMTRSHRDTQWWITFFAPSSSQFAYPFLQKHFRFLSKDASPLPKPDEASSNLLPIARVAAIGRVTSTYLEEELKIRVDAVATKPSPEALSDAISTTMR